VSIDAFAAKFKPFGRAVFLKNMVLCIILGLVFHAAKSNMATVLIS